MSLRGSKRSRDAFTLVELLVVIAIIALLATLLMPKLSKAKEKAKQIRCASNQRQLATALLMYTHDHEDTIPYAVAFFPPVLATNWYDLLWPNYISGERRNIYDRKPSQSVWVCPSRVSEIWRPNDGTRDRLRGRIGIVAHWRDVKEGAIYEKLSSFFVSFYSPARVKIKTNRVKRPSESIAFLDAGNMVRSPVRKRFAIPDRDGDGIADLPSKPQQPQDNNFRVHQNSSQMAFFDGHVERIHFRNLWAYDNQGNLTHRYWYPE